MNWETIARLLQRSEPPPPPRGQGPQQRYPFGPGAVMDPAAPFPVGPGAAGRWDPDTGAAMPLSSVLAATVNGQGLPERAPPAPDLGHAGFAPPSAPQQPAIPPLQARSSPQAVAAALADMDAQAAGPWTERPQGFLQGIGWELRELLIQREMERQRLEREAERLGRRNGPAR